MSRDVSQEIINELNVAINKKGVKEMALSLFYETRINQPIAPQYYKVPSDWDSSVGVFNKHRDMIPLVVKKTWPSLHEISQEMAKTEDIIERMSQWAQHIANIEQ